jgi:protein gp37
MAKGSETGGCLNCYAAKQAARGLPGLNSPTTGEPYARTTTSGPRWTGKVDLIPKMLAKPLSWRKPRPGRRGTRCFVNSMSDLFHESLPFEHIAAVFGIMAACPHITFQVLTKRPERAVKFFRWVETFADLVQSTVLGVVLHYAQRECPDPSLRDTSPILATPWPLPNVWLGTSVEDQATADLRIPLLRSAPAAVQFVSYEPALGPVDFTRFQPIDWLICGGESGPGARPMHSEWARSARDQCQAAGVPFFFKQWGEWVPGCAPGRPWAYVSLDGTVKGHGQPVDAETRDWDMVRKVGKSAAGRLLDGRTWEEFPEVGR